MQGPQTRAVPVDLPARGRLRETVEFTPRVTGRWDVLVQYRAAEEGRSFHGGAGWFIVPGPVNIRLDRVGTEEARIGEPVRVGVVVESTAPMEGAELRVASGGPPGQAAAAGAFRPGLLHRVLDAEASPAVLAALGPGAAANATLEVVGRASGRFDVVPFVLFGGHAYASRPYDAALDGPLPDGSVAGGYLLQVAVQPRPVPAAFALAPFAVGLALVMGAWAWRSRLAK